jgi:DNA polymerase-3 subunit delta
MIYVFHGTDDFTSAETVRVLRARLAASDPMAELNTSEVDGRAATVGSLQAAADALPFLGDRRLVLVRGMLERCNPRVKGGKDLAQSLLGYLPHVPPSTRLVFHDGVLGARNPVLEWAKKQARSSPKGDDAVVVRCFESPKAVRLPGWLAKRAEASDGRIEPAAAIALSDALTRDGEVDLRHASSELEKLLTFAGDRAITVDDVEAIVTPVSIESVFKLVDALAARNGPTATSLMHRFLDEGERPLRLMALITWQFRLITRAKLMRESGISDRELQRRLPVQPFVAKKVSGQARRFSSRTLQAALRRLVEAEWGIKTGRVDAVLALDLFVSELCGPVQPRSSQHRR